MLKKIKWFVLQQELGHFICTIQSNQTVIWVYDHFSLSTVIYLWHEESYEAAALQRNRGKTTPGYSPGASHTRANLGFPLLTLPPQAAKALQIERWMRNKADETHSEMVNEETATADLILTWKILILLYIIISTRWHCNAQKNPLIFLKLVHLIQIWFFAP